MSVLLVADSGGTKTRLGVIDLDNEAAGFIVQDVYLNSDFAAFEAVVEKFIHDHSTTAENACLSVAGVIKDNSVSMTNLAWFIDGEKLAERFGWSQVLLINDMTALTMGIPHLGKNDIHELKSGVSNQGDTISVIAPGTGLGQGYLVPSDDDYLFKCSEGGHSGFTPTNTEELDISRWLIETTGFATAEQVCSGPAISTLFDYYMQKGDIAPMEHVVQQVEMVEDATPIIASAATADEPCPLCKQVINTFLGTLGREAANQALKLYARGGVYVGGGVANHLIGKVSFQPFIDSFLNNGKMDELLSTIPVYVIKSSDVLMLGALEYARKMLSK